MKIVGGEVLHLMEYLLALLRGGIKPRGQHGHPGLGSKSQCVRGYFHLDGYLVNMDENLDEARSNGN